MNETGLVHVVCRTRSCSSEGDFPPDNQAMLDAGWWPGGKDGWYCPTCVQRPVVVPAGIAGVPVVKSVHYISIMRDLRARKVDGGYVFTANDLRSMLTHRGVCPDHDAMCDHVLATAEEEDGRAAE